MNFSFVQFKDASFSLNGESALDRFKYLIIALFRSYDLIEVFETILSEVFQEVVYFIFSEEVKKRELEVFTKNIFAG